MPTRLRGYNETPTSGQADSRSIPPVWLFLCGALAVGLALWSLYLVGLGLLTIAAIVIGGAPKSSRWRVATLIAMLVGFELAMATLAALYWLAWDRRDGGWYVYLVVLAAAGAAILSLVLLVSSRKAIPRRP